MDQVTIPISIWAAKKKFQKIKDKEILNFKDYFFSFSKSDVSFGDKKNEMRFKLNENESHNFLKNSFSFFITSICKTETFLNSRHIILNTIDVITKNQAFTCLYKLTNEIEDILIALKNDEKTNLKENFQKNTFDILYPLRFIINPNTLVYILSLSIYKYFNDEFSKNFKNEILSLRKHYKIM